MEGPDRIGSLELHELLRRAHRSELAPLAAVLGLEPEQWGFDALVRELDQRLRRLAKRGLPWGRAPAYGQILANVARSEGIDPALDAIEQERALLAKMKPIARRRWWSLVPLVSFLGPVAGLLAFAWADHKKQRLRAAVLEVARLRERVADRVTIGFIGSPSAGKDAALKALFGLDTGQIHPVAGSTREVTITRLPGKEERYVVNTPGLGDVLEEVSEEARAIIEHMDLIVVIINAQGGVRARERAQWEDAVARGRPVLAVINKIDTVKPQERGRYLEDARQKLGAPERDFLAAAFDPLPQLATEPIGVEAVREWLASRVGEVRGQPAAVTSRYPPPPAHPHASVTPPGSRPATTRDKRR